MSSSTWHHACTAGEGNGAGVAARQGRGPFPGEGRAARGAGGGARRRAGGAHPILVHVVPGGDDAVADGGIGRQGCHIGARVVLIGAGPVDPPVDIDAAILGDAGCRILPARALEPLAELDERLGLGALGVVRVAEHLALRHRLLPLR